MGGDYLESFDGTQPQPGESEMTVLTLRFEGWGSESGEGGGKRGLRGGSCMCKGPGARGSLAGSGSGTVFDKRDYTGGAR